MSEMFYTPQNEWIKLCGNQATLGLIEKALTGDIVYIELPAVGQSVTKGMPCASVESTKAVVEVQAPVSGIVSAVNDTVYDDPDVVTQKRAWLIRIEFEGEADTSGWLKSD